MAASWSLCVSSSGRRVLAAGFLMLLMWWCETAYMHQDPSGASYMGIGPKRQALKDNRHTQKRSWGEDGLFRAIGWQSAGWASWATQRVLLALILVETAGYITTNDEVKHTMLRVGEVLSLGGQMAVWWSVLATVSNRSLPDSQEQMYACHSSKNEVLARLQLSTTTLCHLALQTANSKAEAVASTAGICCCQLLHSLAAELCERFAAQRNAAVSLGVCCPVHSNCDC